VSVSQRRGTLLILAPSCFDGGYLLAPAAYHHPVSHCRFVIMPIYPADEFSFVSFPDEALFGRLLSFDANCDVNDRLRLQWG